MSFSVQSPKKEMTTPVRLILFALSLLFTAALYGQNKKQTVLEGKLRQLVNTFHGDVGIYVRHLKSGLTVNINADSVFPTASMIKIPITIGVFDKIESGELGYFDELVYHDSLLYEGVDLLGSFKSGEKIELNKLLMLMITMSDNTASLWCQHLAGTGTAINQWLEKHGFIHTRVNSRTPGREFARSRYGWGQTSPREMAELVVRISEGNVVSSRASERIYRNLGNIYWDNTALSQIPPYVATAAKQGAVNQSRSEVVLVNAPHGAYVFCIITKNQKDESWTRDNEGFALLRNVSAMLWNFFEPNDKWKPAADIQAWR